MSKLILKPASSALQPELFVIYETVFREHIEKIWGWDDAWQRDNFAAEWENFETTALFLEGSPIGYFQVRQEPTYLMVLNIAIAPKHQQQGFGSEIMAYLKSCARKNGTGIELSVFKTNPRALRFYEREGFTIEGETDVGSNLVWAD